MVQRIDQDRARFREIVRGSVKKDLRKYLSSGELIGKQGKRFVSIPLPQIELPRFRFGSNKGKGVGQGEGGEGEPAGTGDGDGAGQAGEQAGQHVLEVEVGLDELAQIMGEELALPRIESKGKKTIRALGGGYSSISRVGPESLRHFKRTFREALKRTIASGTYDPANPIVIPVKEDRRYRSFKLREVPDSSAVVIYMMDVSGSMGREQKEIVRIESFWIDTWLRSQYKNIEVRYVVHDAAAQEVDQHTFYNLRESGGTKISSAYELLLELLERKYAQDEWNVYPFHFSDGDNWSARDTERCVSLMKEKLLPRCNQFAYGQVKSAYGSGQFKKDLDSAFRGDERVVTSDILDRDSIPESIRHFLGKGR
ncbi:MAG: DUF444 family protein [Planctomycetes bacterium]|nr:DUF444 family protein [Planctomycetota bacterium]